MIQPGTSINFLSGLILSMLCISVTFFFNFKTKRPVKRTCLNVRKKYITVFYLLVIKLYVRL